MANVRKVRSSRIKPHYLFIIQLDRYDVMSFLDSVIYKFQTLYMTFCNGPSLCVDVIL